MSTLAPDIGSKSKATAADDSGSEQGKTYEKLLFTLLAKEGYQLSKDGKFKDGEFAIGREIDMAPDMKFDDIVFSYKDMDNAKNLVFVQVKHKQNDNQVIYHEILSTEEWKAKGDLQKNFNLQKYFISFLRIREELKNATSQELEDGKIKHVAIYTNIGLATDKLNLKSNNDDSLSDIKSIFSFEKSSSRHSEFIVCYQLNDVSKELREIFLKSSDLHRIARELAQHVLGENGTKSNILGKGDTAVNFYQVALEREVIRKSPKKLDMENEQYCVAYFRKDFIDNEDPDPKKELRDALFQGMREFAESGMYASEDELKIILKKVELKVTANFGKTKHKRTELPLEWTSVKRSDIDDFLECFVFLVNQPNVTYLIAQIYSEKDSILKGTHVGQVLDNMDPKLRDRIEKELGFNEKDSRKEMWLFGEQIVQFVQEQREAVNISVITLLYEERIMQYGEFIDTGKLAAILDSFLSCKRNNEITEEHHLLLKESKILNVYSEITLLSTIKILQHLNTKNYRAENGQISIELGDLMEMRDRVEKAFNSETYKLLIIECRHNVDKQNAEEICRSFSAIIKSKQNKKIIIINKQGESNILADRFMFYLKKHFQNDCNFEKLYAQETDDIYLKDFEPAENPLEKEIIVFQGQEEKINLASLTGFEDWNSYVYYLSQCKFFNKSVIADIMIEILTNDDIAVGSKPPGTSSLEGAHDTLFEEINPDTLLHKLLDIGNKPLEDDRLEDAFKIFQETNTDTLAQNFDNNANEILIFDGITGSNIKEKMYKLAEYLGLVNEQETIANLVGDIRSDTAIQIAHDHFKDENFKQICRDHPKREIFWIGVKSKGNELKFILQGFYNPNFYLKRKFKNLKMVIDKKVKNLLMEDNLTELFIFSYVSNLEELMESLELTDETEKGKVESNYKKSLIKLCISDDDAEVVFQELCKENPTVHWLNFEKNQLMWCNTYGSVYKLHKYIDHKESEIAFVDEDNVIKYIRYRKVVIIADEPGMGKTTTLTKLYESESFLKTHWIVTINLRDRIQAIKNIQLANGNIDVINFLSDVDLKLSHNLSKSLLQFALDKSKNILKPLLLVFDGFDELLDVEDRSKIISLLKFLKEETAAKVWITTRLHCKHILETELSTFAIGFDPINDKDQVAYIKNYLKDRMSLILSMEKFAEIFVHNDKIQENKSIEIYIAEFLNKVKSVFSGDILQFIGTPLQLYLMLKGCISHFKDWAENSEDQNPNFDYLGMNILEVYKHFLDSKYRIYFKKMGIKEGLRQKQDKYIFSQYNKSFARSLILKSKMKKSIENFKDMVLAAGIIKYHGSNPEFIHATFIDYFAAKVFIHWMKSVPIEPSRTYKQEYILKEILKKPEYQLIRTFINLKLKKYVKTEFLKESVKHYGMIAEKLFREEESSLIDDEHSVLHYAVQEGNKNILLFFLNSLKEHKDVLEKFLFHRVVYEKSALDLVFHRNDIEILTLLLDAAEGISEKTLQELLYFCDKHGRNVLDTAAVWCKNVEIVKELLNRAENKLDLIVNENKEQSSLNVALIHKNGEFVKFLIREFKHDEDSLKQLLLFYDKDFANALGVALRHDNSMVEHLLCTAKAMRDEYKTLKEMLLSEKHAFNNVPLITAISTRKIHFVEMLLNAAKDINDDTLRKMFLNDVSQDSVFLFAAMIGRGDILKLLLETADSFGQEVLQKFILSVNTDGNNALYLMVEYNVFLGNISVDILKLLLETAANLGQEVLEKLVFGSNKNGKTVIHLMAVLGLGYIINELFKIPEEFKYQCIGERVMEMFHSILEEHKLSFYKCVLIVSVQNQIINDVEIILESAKNFNINRNEKIRNLLLTVDSENRNSLHIACLNGNLRIIKELLSYAINIHDEGTTLKQLITSTFIFNTTPFKMLRLGYTSEIKQIVESLILEAKKNNNEHVANILQEINEKFAEINSNSYNLTVDSRNRNSLHIACLYGNLKFIKELLSYAINIHDEGTTLWQSITSTFIFNLTPFQMLRFGYTSEIKQIVKSLIIEAKKNNNQHVVNILQDINENYAEINSNSYNYAFLPCNNNPF